jgi:cytoskeleton protein RodZ
MGTTNDASHTPDSTGNNFGSVGEEFTRARIACAMEQREAAKAMGISLMTLQALESGDFQRIGSPLLVRGHLSRYAQLLDLPEQPILDRYEQAIAAELAATSTRDGGARRRGRATGWLKWVSYGLIPVFLGGLSWLSLDRLGSSPEPVQESAAPIAEASPEQPIATASPPESGPVQDQVVGDPVPAADVTEPSPVDTDAPPQLGQAVAVDAGSETPGRDDAGEATFAPAATESPSEAMAAASETREPETADAEVAAGSAEPMSSAPTAGGGSGVEKPHGKSQLLLRFSEDCWLEIRDAEGNRLAYGLAKQGTTTTVSGPAPFSLVLGYAPGVEIELDGSPVDRGLFVPARGAVSRFSLGEPAQGG